MCVAMLLCYISITKPEELSLQQTGNLSDAALRRVTEGFVLQISSHSDTFQD